MLDKITLKKIRKLGLETDWNSAFGGKSKGNKHLLRVARIAKFLATRTNANLPIVEAGAFLHDTALPSGDDYNYLLNKRIVKDLLKKFNLSKNELDGIAECVASHEGTTTPKSLEAKVVHDADVLEKVGLLGTIRHTWKMTNLKKLDDKKIKYDDVNKILNHIEWRSKKLQTPVAKLIVKYLVVPIDKQKAKTIITLTAKLASKGVITEKIALAVRKHLNQKEKEKLKEQLSLSYLRTFI